MFEKYSYKKKCAALLVVFVMLSITAYKRSFHALFEVVRENRSLVAKVEDMKNKSDNPELLRKEISEMDKLLGKEGTAKEEVQQGIVSFAAGKNPGISINDLQPIHIFSDENHKVITNLLDVTGNANQLLQLGYDFEKNFTYSRMVSMDFYTTKKNNSSESLHLRMIFQNYENNK